MAVSTNHNLGGRVIYLRLYLIDIVRKIIGRFRVIVPFKLQVREVSTMALFSLDLPHLGYYDLDNSC